MGASEAAPAEHCQPHEGPGIGVGGDEVFLGLPVLGLAELASGDIFPEVLDTHEPQTWRDLTTALQAPVDPLRQLSQIDSPSPRLNSRFPNWGNGRPRPWRRKPHPSRSKIGG
jgi:hypothetical protein